MTDLITSGSNPLIKRVRALADRKHRRRQGAFVVEGTQPVWQAVEAGADIEVFVVAPGLLPSAAAGMIQTQIERGAAVARVSDGLFARLSDRDRPSGLAAVVRRRVGDLDTLPITPQSLFAVLHEVSNPGNLGTVIRTVDAVGAHGVVLVGSTADPFDPVAVKATMGALFHVPVVRAVDAEEFFAWTADHDVATAATSAKAETDFRDADYPTPAALLLGGEGPGLPDAVAARAHRQLRIPMTGHAESLNLAVAAGLLLYQARSSALGA